jgi:hypothetical protein
MGETRKKDFAGLEHETGWAGVEGASGPKTPHMDKLWGCISATLHTLQLSGFQATLGLTINDFGKENV